MSTGECAPNEVRDEQFATDRPRKSKTTASC
jgi:hypothetical protein